MTLHFYTQMVRYKRWAGAGIYGTVAQYLPTLPASESRVLRQIFDHVHVVDRIFQHHLLGTPHSYSAARSPELPGMSALAEQSEATDHWYVDYVDQLSPEDMAMSVEFRYANGSPARMSRGEIISHVCLHGAYHRGNAAYVLHQCGIAHVGERMTDFIESADWSR